MSDALRDRRVAILAADGVERVEVEQPRQAVEDAGAQAELLSRSSAARRPPPRGTARTRHRPISAGP
jgi:putative intracellular protease/amidase